MTQPKGSLWYRLRSRVIWAVDRVGFLFGIGAEECARCGMVCYRGRLLTEERHMVGCPAAAEGRAEGAQYEVPPSRTHKERMPDG